MSAQMIMFSIEIIQMRDKGFREYIKETWNKIDMANFGLSVIYYILRMYNAEKVYLVGRIHKHNLAHEDHDHHLSYFFIGLMVMEYLLF